MHQQGIDIQFDMAQVRGNKYLCDDCIQAGLNTLVGWGLEMFMKVLGLVSFMEKMISDPSEPTFVIRVCQICKIPKL